MSRNEDTPIATRCNNYGTTPTPLLQPTDRSCSGDNNNTPLTVPSQIFCLHGRSNNIEVEVRDHCHRARSEGVDLNARRKLIIASILCLVFMIAEIVGGVLSNSLAIATDAAHLLTDFASFMISLFAIWIAGRPSTQRMSFGWYRAEVIGAIASVFMIWVITGILVWLAIGRLINGDYEVNAKIMLITSGLAILVNVIMGVQLQHGHSHSLGGGHGHSHSHNSTKKTSKSIKENKITAHMHATSTPCSASPTKRIEGGVAFDPEDAELPGAGLPSYSYQNAKLVDPSLDLEIAAVLAETAPGAHHHGGNAGHEAVNMNVRAALIHVIGDVIQSVGVFVAAGVIYFYPEYAIVDPICTFVFSIIVLFTTFTIMKDALLVLMEGTPNYMHYAEVLQIFQRINGVERVHNLRIWALSINKVALSVHLAIATNADSKQILDAATSAVHLRYNFFETTIQIEDYTAQMENCNQCTVPEN
ncbi:proton-coupled zinc antiporter SLC30A2 isoform X1 [Drosophila sulfurigaster albostrigata]|uniref:proton-coupled zinc antiporter SLC30A2 isoform X1 n=1 Tax=Drosophila sulfurigaster albostrigata TaxID=89887 RepID=UPI002D21A333|nr:proton-coupled zinc antiporter SLC30A2 isoform X1 [Drosophila sulfurigaster albostrigata]